MAFLTLDATPIPVALNSWNRTLVRGARHARMLDGSEKSEYAGADKWRYAGQVVPQSPAEMAALLALFLAYTAEAGGDAIGAARTVRPEIGEIGLIRTPEADGYREGFSFTLHEV